MKTNEQEKKDNYLVYVSGSGITADQAKEFLKLPELTTVGAGFSVSDGIATKENSRSERKLSLGKEKDSFSNLIKDKSSAFINKVSGYNEKTHINNLGLLVEALEHQPKNLVLAGHSRGSAVGLTGIITGLYAEAIKFGGEGLNKSEDFLKNLDKISIISMDPVSGPSYNDSMGLGKVGQDDTPSISEMLNTISKVAGKPDLFDVTVMMARYDARPQFVIDERWEDFVNENKGNKCDVYHLGFQHSEMAVDKEMQNEKLLDKKKILTLDIYDKGARPTDLTNAIIAQKLGSKEQPQQVLDDRVKQLASSIQDIELKAIEELKTGKNEGLKEFTGKKGYIGLRKFLVKGSIGNHINKEGNIHGRTIESKHVVVPEEEKERQKEKEFKLPNSLANAIETANNALEAAAKINELNFKEPLNSTALIAPKKPSKNTSNVIQKAKSKSVKM